MIRFSLQCKDAHRFDGWFRSGEDFQTQQKRGLLACPQCGTTTVEKALMTPSVPKKSNRTMESGGEGPAQGERDLASDAQSQPRPAAAKTPIPVPMARNPQEAISAMPAELQGKVLQAMKQWRDNVIANSEHVGTRFAEEARKIHFNEADERPIYGEASADEVEELLEEGVACAPLPVFPEDHN
uniref:DUF1178 family protein n=1 Tax=Pararhizobium sp. IMCC3301 TaxID=3067904 RepID=UPI0027417F9D|nr:DUF1178 family protein [Pararhizobium sp. IMCC3301]